MKFIYNFFMVGCNTASNKFSTMQNSIKTACLKIVMIIFLSLLSLAGFSQNIISIAGGGTGSGVDGLGDGLQATQARINVFAGIAIDKHNNIYIADANNQRVRKISVTTGIISCIAGTGVAGFSGDGTNATGAKLSNPKFVAIDKIGNVYFSDVGNNRIRKIDTFGIITTFAGNDTAGYNGDSRSATSAFLNGPQGLVFDTSGNLYFSDIFNFRIRKIDFGTNIIHTVVGDGTLGSIGDSGPATSAEINGVFDIAIDSVGNLYIADFSNNKVRKVDALSGIITMIAGTGGSGIYNGDNILATNAQLEPYSMALDKMGNLYVSDHQNNRIRKINAITDTISTIAGTGVYGFSGDNGLASLCEISRPDHILFDSCGNLFFADEDNKRIRKVIFNPSCGPTLNISSTNINLNVTFYPNPATKQITIRASQNIADVTITNLIGQTLLSQNFKSETAEVNISKLPSGVYLVAVTDEEGQRTVRKVVKQ